MPTRIFFSHSTHDNEWCRPLVGMLKDADLDVWYDEQGLSGGAAWVQTLQREVQARDVFLLVVSPDYLASHWCQEELQLAIATRRTILPILHRPAPVEGFLLTRQWVDATNLSGTAAAARVLLALGSVAVFAPPARPKAIVAAPQIVPPSLAALGFLGRTCDGIAVITPPLGEVPAGPFLMGTNPALEPEWAENEPRQRTVELPAYRIARFPVTVAEYACAVQAGALSEPNGWLTQVTHPDHPVVLISWKRAQDYAGWLAQTTGEPWRLPTEPEWEKAARGTDGRIFPWGNEWDPRRANTSDGGPGTTSPVGAYPGGVSPYGVFELAGSVNEWCGIPASSPQAQPGDDVGKGYLAGGSWNDSPAWARAAHRSQLFIGERTEDTGMRLVWQLT